ncbi:hypothetical protein LB505_006778 [Fusarium chuoi]|nr:hypothetical protein LB505_006778 [Fusarium chuoi]
MSNFLKMASLLIKISIAATAILAILFQIYLKEAIWLGFGINRNIQPLSEFPYQCRKIVHHRLEACEDMYLSQSTRQLFLALLGIVIFRVDHIATLSLRWISISRLITALPFAR